MKCRIGNEHWKGRDRVNMAKGEGTREGKKEKERVSLRRKEIKLNEEGVWNGKVWKLSKGQKNKRISIAVVANGENIGSRGPRR